MANRCSGFTKAGRNQLGLALVLGNIPNSIDSWQIGLVAAAGLDSLTLDGQGPLGDFAQGRDEPIANDEVIDG